MKKTVSILLVLLLLAGLLCGCGPKIAPEAVALTDKLESCSLFLEPVEELPEDFIFGMDLSSVLAEERSGVVYCGFDGQVQDVFRTLAQAGVNYIRVRVWNEPFDAEGRGYGGGNCDIDAALEIGKRATKYGMKLLVDFHYSDFWADPGKQRAPKAWQDMDLETKAAALEAYTRESLQRLKDAGVEVGMAALGNETNGAMCGETVWENAVTLMKSGAKAVRAIFPEARVAVHFTNPENKGSLVYWAQTLADAGLDYDVFGTSYYPYWHGSLENLTQSLSDVAETFGKQVMVMETSYAYTGEDTDFHGNTVSVSGDAGALPYTVLGQATSVRNVIEAVARAKNGVGVCYWEGAWITVGGSSKAENEKLWEEFGSGWASSFAGEYDPDAGQWYGGSAVDNQAMFDPQGRPLESLLVFALARSGNKGDGVPAVIPTQAPTPEAVGGDNLLQNGGFESGEEAPWVLEDRGGCQQLYPEEKPGDSRSGDWHYHFWTPDAGAVDFSLEQSPEGLAPGIYDFSVWIMGGDCGAAEVYAYVKLDGEIVAEFPMEISVWNEWHPGEIRGVEYAEGQSLTVGIRVKTDAAGAWGKIDDAVLTKREED